jgi:hypothetical protein
MITPIIKLFLNRITTLSIDSPSLLSLITSLEAEVLFYFFSGWVGRWGRLRAEEAPNWLNGSPNNPRVLDSTTVAVRPNCFHWFNSGSMISDHSINRVQLEPLDILFPSKDHWLAFDLQYSTYNYGPVLCHLVLQDQRLNYQSTSPWPTRQCSTGSTLAGNNKLCWTIRRDQIPCLLFFFSGGSAVPRPARTDQVLSYNMKE